MAATPFTGTITLRYGDGKVQIEPFTASDVTNAFVTFSATNNNFIQTRNMVGVIADLNLSAGGVDTKQIAVFVNGADQSMRYLGSGLVATVNNRVPAPSAFAPGVTIQLKQI